MIILFLILPLLSAICYLVLAKHYGIACKVSQLLHIALLIAAFYSIINFQPSSIISFRVLSLSQIKLNLLFALDKLSLSMLLLISFISTIVNRYAARYVYSDLNRSRFLFQLSLVTFSVIFLVLSANLLTAFIGWQLIGFHLYWLLNHYHYDENANRAAKKKFVINRIGDVSFLLAVIISLYYYSSTDFQVILSVTTPTISIFEYQISISTIILSCIFLAVMTKSAQFPFHIWLPDTMQSPTPVSAMMHAGVINAGGYLLARLAPGIIAAPKLLIFISCIGFTTLLLGNLFSLTQPDIKKQFAYSTMSQMGYMVLQCGLGFFVGAVFHLISHGLFKAWSFLNSGNQLLNSYSSDKKNNITSHLISVIIFLIILCLSLYLSNTFYQLFFNFPLLVIFFAITVYQLINNIIEQRKNTQITSLSVVFVLAIVAVYLYLLADFHSWLQPTFPSIGRPLIINFQHIIISSLVIFYLIYLYIKYYKPQGFLISYTDYLIRHKLFIEEAYRRYLLSPIRDLGDIFYQFFIQKKFVSFLIIALLLLSNIFNHNSPFFFPMLPYIFDLILLMLFLLTANRASDLKYVLLFLTLSQFTLALIAYQLFSTDAVKIAYFQLINTTSLSLLMMVVLHKIKYGKKLIHMVDNNLPWLGAYLTAVLFCLIGLPFTSSFISEVIILKETIRVSLILTTALLIVIVLFAVSILHTLQDYIFKASAIERLSIRLSKAEHLLFIGWLLFNLLNGLYPSYILRIL